MKKAAIISAWVGSVLWAFIAGASLFKWNVLQQCSKSGYEMADKGSAYISDGCVIFTKGLYSIHKVGDSK